MHAPSASPRQLLQYVLDDDLDAALDAGLMDYAPQPSAALSNIITGGSK